MAFDEKIFIRALIDRPADARKYGRSFNPMWLKSIELRPVLVKLFDFTKKYATPPSISTLRQLFIDEDAKAYEIRFKDVLDGLDATKPDPSEVLYCLSKVHDSAVVMSLESLVNSHGFTELVEAQDGAEVMAEVKKWMTNFHDPFESVELNIEDAFLRVLDDRGWKNESRKIPTHIEFIDEWCGGGLNPKQLGIVLAPTGNGKSVVLCAMADHLVKIDKRKVLYISNELAWDEVALRFATLFTGIDLNTMDKEPLLMLQANERAGHFKGLLKTWEIMKEITTDEIEVKLKEYLDLYGWAPEVIILDYMERMAPTTSGYKRDATWNWYGAIAQDLVRLAKKTGTLIWTAGQSNRSGMNTKNEQSMEHTQGSIKHLQEASAVISFRERKDYSKVAQRENEYVKILEFTALKMRHAKGASGVKLVETDFSKMLITNKYHTPEDFKGLTDEDQENFKDVDPDKMVDDKKEVERNYEQREYVPRKPQRRAGRR